MATCKCPESESFLKHFSELVEALQDPSQMGDLLFSKGFIGSGMFDELITCNMSRQMKNRRLLLAVESIIKHNPTKFQEFLDILRREGAHEYLAQRLQSSLGELKNYMIYWTTY